ncbi:MAG: serine protein kinase RIO, partial [Candidatus Korarchaeota archaeon]|nr:serine protein kinase RIO [Candidatus Korarchaeota archaeon]
MSDRFEELEEKIERLLERDREKEKRIKDEDYFKVKQLAFDNRTIRALLKLFNKGVLDDVTWVISAGKESLILAGRGPEGELAIKIYRIYTSNFKKYLDYIIGDHRFPPIKDR